MIPFADILEPLENVAESVLNFFHDNVGLSWGTSIIALTVCVRAILIPLTYKQIKGMRALQALQPQIKAIQEKYKNDRQRQQQEMMRFYQENKVNPLASCLPLLLQLPIFFALFRTLRGDSFQEDVEASGGASWAFINSVIEKPHGRRTDRAADPLRRLDGALDLHHDALLADRGGRAAVRDARRLRPGRALLRPRRPRRPQPLLDHDQLLDRRPGIRRGEIDPGPGRAHSGGAGGGQTAAETAEEEEAAAVGRGSIARPRPRTLRRLSIRRVEGKSAPSSAPALRLLLPIVDRVRIVNESSEQREWPEEPAERVRELVEGVLDELDLEGEVEVTEDDDAIEAVVDGEDDYGLLIGRRGQTIDALQLLCYQAAFRGIRERKRVLLDAAGYRERRREVLTARADRAAEQALSANRIVEMDPMSAQERRVVHEYLRDRAGVETYSEGDEPHRCVVVAPLVSTSEPRPDLAARRRGTGRAAHGSRAARRGAGLGQLGRRARPGPGRSTSPTASPASRSPTSASAERIADIGAGAGFPGLPLAVALPAAQVDLIESVGRKCEFIERAIDAAGIANARVLYARSEEWAAAAGRAGRPTTRSPRAPSAGSRPWPSWPRRCCARAACWSPGRGGGTRRRRRRLAARRDAVGDGARAGARRRPLRRQPQPPPPPAAQDGPDPERSSAPSGNGEEAPPRLTRRRP